MKKRILASLLSLSLSFSMFTTAFATDGGEGSADTMKDVSAAAEMSEGQADAYWGHIPEDKTFAFADSRYYDGTDYVKVFNVGFYMGTSGQYYANGDWTDLTKVYRREDYYKTEEFKTFSNTGNVGDPKPEGYPTNDVGGDAEGKLPSYNAGVYTYLAWTDFEMFGRSWFINYGIDSVINVPRVTTYVEIWRVEPNLRLTTDKTTVERGDEFTATLSIENHFDNYDGLPTAEQVFFSADHAVLVSDTVTETDNHYTATFRATEDLSANEIEITAGVNDTATNYKPATTTTTLPLPAVTYTVTYTDGVKNETVFGDQVHSGLSAGVSTPAFNGTPSRDGYEFSGWTPEVAGIVTGNATYTAVWTKKPDTPLPSPAVTYTVTYTDGVKNETVFGDQVHSGLSAGVSTPAFNGTPSRDGYEFSGWTPEVAGIVTGNATYTAVWTKKSGDRGDDEISVRYTLTYDSNGGIEYKDEQYQRNTTVDLDKVPTREGYTFTGWYADEELTERITEIRMTSDKTVYAGWEPTGIPDWLNGADHFAYVIGYTDGTVRPLNNISRAEVASIFFRLLNEDTREENLTADNTFTDVHEGMWCNTAISTMAKLGIVKGRSQEHFDPNAPITRAEFAAICARFDTSKRNGDSDFADIAGHWAEAEIGRAATLGWIMGYTDGTFRPENNITRAEAMTMINRVLNRLPQSEDDLLDGMNIWPDNQLGAWYYLAVQEATNSHDFNRKGDVHEQWSKLTADPDWTKYEK